MQQQAIPSLIYKKGQPKVMNVTIIRKCEYLEQILKLLKIKC